MTVDLEINGKRLSVAADTSTPLLWVLREDLGLTGTKFGCGVEQCGACSVHVDGRAVRSGVSLLSNVAGSKITPIEGLIADLANPFVRASVETDLPQCRYCQSGQIMSAAVLPAGHARGISLHFSFASLVADVIEASTENGELRVHRAVCAIDRRRTVNPDTIVAQLEGAVGLAPTGALFSEIVLDKDRVKQSNFHSYSN